MPTLEFFNIVVCDDNDDDRKAVAQAVQQWSQQKRQPIVVSEHGVGEELIKRVQDGFHPDVVFIDIFMGELNGYDTAKALRENGCDCAIVFLTTTDEFAIKGYSVKAFDYLLKPIEDNIKRLHEILQELNRDKHSNSEKVLDLKKVGKRIPLSNILYLESDLHKVIIHTTGGTKHSVRGKLSDIDYLLDDRFLWCNRSYIVNMDLVVNAGNCFTMEDGSDIPIKVRARKQMRDKYFDWVGKTQF